MASRYSESHYSRGSIDTMSTVYEPPSLRRPSPPDLPGKGRVGRPTASSSRSPPNFSGGGRSHRHTSSAASTRFPVNPSSTERRRQSPSASRSPHDTRGMNTLPPHHHHLHSSSSGKSVQFKGVPHRHSPSQSSRKVSELAGGDVQRRQSPSQSREVVPELASLQGSHPQMPSQSSVAVSSLSGGEQSYRHTPSSSISALTASVSATSHRHTPSSSRSPPQGSVSAASNRHSPSQNNRGPSPVVTNLEPAPLRKPSPSQKTPYPPPMPIERDFGSESSLESLKKEKNKLPEPGVPNIAPWRITMLFIALTCGLFLSFLDGSITATAIYTIGNDFNAQTKINWIALTYILADVGCAVLLPSLGDLIGRKHAYTIAMLMFFGFSIGCGAAQNINQLLAFRVLQGIGGSGLYSLAMVIFPEISTFKMKQMIGAFTGMTVAIAGVTGPILGAVLTDYASWRWIFYINIPISAIAMTLFLVAWPTTSELRQYTLLSWRDFDFAGNILLIGASVLVVFAFQEAGVEEADWDNRLFIAPLVLGILCWIAFFAWEAVLNTKWKPNEYMEPLIPTRLVKNRIYMANLFYTLFSGFVFFILIYSIPIRFQVVNQSSVLAAGVALLPMLISSAIGSMLAGALNSQKDYSFYVLTSASILMALGCGLLSNLDNQLAKQSTAYGEQVLVGFGFGLSVSTASIMASVHCELQDHAIAQGLMSQVRVLGGALGIAASTAILGVHERAALGPVSTAQSAEFFSNRAGLTPTQLTAIRDYYSASFSETMKVCAELAVGTFFIALLSFSRKPVSLAERVAEQEQNEARRLEDLEMRELAMTSRPYDQPCCHSRHGSKSTEERDADGNLIYHLPPPPPPAGPTHQPLHTVREAPTRMTRPLAGPVEKMEDEHTTGNIPVFLSPNTAETVGRSQRRFSQVFARARNGAIPRYSRDSQRLSYGGGERLAPFLPHSVHIPARPPSSLHPANRPSGKGERTSKEAVRHSLYDWLVWSPDSNAFRGATGKKTSEYF